MKNTLIAIAAVLLAVLLLVSPAPVKGQGYDYEITYTYDDERFIWNEPPDYCQWDANRWPDDKWGGNWQTAPLSNSGSYIGDVSCTIFSSCNAISALLGQYIDPGQEAVEAYEAGVMSAYGVDYTGALYMADKYGIAAEMVEAGRLAEVLKEGKPVIAFTRGSVFSGGDHAISLFGYQDGTTFVRDPSNPERWTDPTTRGVGGKWYSLDYIIAHNPNQAYVAFGENIPEKEAETTENAEQPVESSQTFPQGDGPVQAECVTTVETRRFRTAPEKGSDTVQENAVPGSPADIALRICGTRRFQ